jgi:hypothetical protein
MSQLFDQVYEAIDNGTISMTQYSTGPSRLSRPDLNDSSLHNRFVIAVQELHNCFAIALCDCPIASQSMRNPCAIALTFARIALQSRSTALYPICSLPLRNRCSITMKKMRKSQRDRCEIAVNRRANAAQLLRNYSQTHEKPAPLHKSSSVSHHNHTTCTIKAAKLEWANR